MRVGKRFHLIAVVLSTILMSGLIPALASTADASLVEEARQLTDLAWHGLETLQPKSMAAPLLKQALQADPDSAWAHFLASRVAATESGTRFHEAEAYRLALLAPQPERGLIEAESSPDAASKTSKLDRLAREYPGDRRVRMALGKALLEGGAVQLAVLEFEQARLLDPGTARVYVYLADCAVRLGDNQLARRHYRSALMRLHPQARAESLFGGLALTYLAEGNARQALSALQNLLPEAPQDRFPERLPALRIEFGFAPGSSPNPSMLQRHRSISRSLEQALRRLRSKTPY